MTDHKSYEDALKDALEYAKECITELKSELTRKDEEIQQLKEALKEITDCKAVQPATSYNVVPIEIMDRARKLIDLNKPEK